MIIDNKLVQQAKEKLNDKNADIMAKELNLQNYDEVNKKALCCWHEEKTPSLIYNPKNYTFHCFSCNRTVDIIEVFMSKGLTFIEAVQKLFELAEIPYAFGEHKVQTKRDYIYPTIDAPSDMKNVIKYMKSRCISEDTLKHFDVREDKNGNVALNYYDTNDVLTMIKYRPSHKINKGEAKMWCQKGADTSHLLYNMNRCNPDMPLVITEGCIDTMSVYEAGCHNVVSVPLGAGNTQWIEQNWDWLEQFKDIIVCVDNDEPGIKLQKEIAHRLGSWRCKYVEFPTSVENELDGTIISIKDANDVLCNIGKDALLEYILTAQDTPIAGVVDFSDIEDVDLDKLDGIYTGFKDMDTKLMKLFFGNLVILTGVNGCVDCDTEFFDGQQWKKISEYKNGDKVLQYNFDRTATLVYPQEYHKIPCESLNHFKTCYGLDQCLSDEHNVVYLSTKGNINIKPFREIKKIHNHNKNGFYGKFITTFNYNGSGIDMSDEDIRVMCAVVCDGSFMNKNDTKCRINIKKTRKQIRLRKLLEAAKIEWTEHHYNPKDLKFISFIFKAPIKAKFMSQEWYNCSQHQLKVICDEILCWDGTIDDIGRRKFSTSNKDMADFIQFAFSSIGDRSTIYINNRVGQEKSNGYIYKNIEYQVSISKQSKTPTIFGNSNGHKVAITDYKTLDGYKYCFTVDSHMLVLRRNGKIFITGNSGKSSFLNQIICQSLNQGYDAFLYSGELPNQQAKNWLLYQFAGRYNLNERTTPSGNIFYVVKPEVKKEINEYYRNRLYIYDDCEDKHSDIVLNRMESLARKYGTKVFIIDNLTAINLGSNENNKYEKQTEFINSLIKFSVTFNVLVMLVVHPHKMDIPRRMTKMDVQGAMAMTDLAHRLIGLYRVTQYDRQQISEKHPDYELYKDDVIVDILKDRMRGYEGQSFSYCYDRASRRFYSNIDELDFVYKWDKMPHKQLPLPNNNVLGMSEDQTNTNSE